MGGFGNLQDETFLGEPDTPADYTGDALKLLRVNAGETAVEFETLANIADALYVNVSGDTMTGDLGMGANNITLTGSIASTGSRVTKGWLDDLTVTNMPTIDAVTQGSILFGGASGVLAQDNTNFFWDDVNDRLGIGTISPQELLHVGAGTDGSDITATDLLVTRAGPSNLSVRDSTNNVETFLFVPSVSLAFLRFKKVISSLLDVILPRYQS